MTNVHQLKSLEQAEVRGKRVIVRVDWNVTIGKAKRIVDDTRIVRTLPTIRWLLAHQAKQIILMSHLGKAEEKRSIEPVVEYASKLLGETIKLVNPYSRIAVNPERVVMLENLRLWEGEEGVFSNQEKVISKQESQTMRDNFARELAKLGDLYVNEAFGESHRDVASIIGIPKYLPAYAGMWLQEEVEAILKVRENPERPFVVVMGGAKVEDKIKLIEVLSTLADTILLGGKLANEWVQKGMAVTGKAKIMTPIEGADLLDIGPATRRVYGEFIAKAKTIVWNGPMGKVEEPQYRAGTEAIYTAINKNEAAYTLVGGGDTLAAITEEKHLTRIDHVSTGGGAMLKMLESGDLVGMEALRNSANQRLS